MSLTDLLPITVIFIGGFMLIKLRAFFLLHPLATFRTFKSALHEGGAVRSLCLALAGTLGVGNIVGVAYGLIVGGSGSVLWLILSSLFAMVLKYSEACISSDVSSGEGGGMLIPLRKSFKMLGGAFSCLYAACALFLAFFMGGALQSVGAVGAISFSVGVDSMYLSLAFALLTVVILVLARHAIKSLTAAVIPLATAIYIALSLGVVILNIGKLPSIISEIFQNAFNFKAALGGGLGGAFILSFREGFLRGILSNEAGAGTSSFAHSEINSSPAAAGVLGMCEVLFDTVILCPITAFAILSVIPNASDYTSAAGLVTSAFRASLGSFASFLVSVCILLFAFSTVVCWFYYGRVCSDYLRLPKRLYTLAFFLIIPLGCMLGERIIVFACDAMLLILTLLTGAVIIKGSDRIKRLSELSGLL